MLDIKGKYTEARIYASKIDDKTVNKITSLTNASFLEGAKIRVMPDCHDGKGAVIGSTITLRDKVSPSLVGVDIGCGMLLVKLGKTNIDFARFDKLTRSLIPLGKSVRDTEPYLLKNELSETYKKVEDIFNSLKIKDKILNKKKRIIASIGTLGGGNHFIEIDENSLKEKYLIIHTGSRYLGNIVAKVYEDIGTQKSKEDIFNYEEEVKKVISTNKEKHTEYLIEGELKSLKEKRDEFNKTFTLESLPVVEGEDFINYIEDMKLSQKFASINREVIARLIVTKVLKMDYDQLLKVECIHNYIDTRMLHGSLILRKGAISSEEGEKVIIPINMRDGVILGVGKGNEEYNFSAPHGAGRLLSRNEARKDISINDYKLTMKGIYSTSVNERTLDESPFAYKSLNDILPNLKSTVDIKEVIKPIYNLKAED